ncbi:MULTISPECIES: OmpP1/FadL family transporter [Pseudomonas]|jgi:long-chain fatty acid transport protein|uniref:Outer membrane protein transport protein n=1 Tax=Pseudomonas kielensis TaxID=2762577 RepID=A0A7X1GFP5_9PSED|nr:MULTISPECIES: outer membrane protein transport protein [Pseudomonas]MBC2691564.1 outer membrane protein transport protein [Pseudomonas kielensis]NBB33213.1 aromatic hydrocarbon degradation protein [Pseudomonas sp. BC115LW]WKL52913.1 outer membrane protein transport protein [Pseudomonas kielensis]
MKRCVCFTLACLGLLAAKAEASNGPQYAGYGTQAMGMGGASIANPTDALAAVNNPAGMGAVGTRIDGSLTATAGQLRSNVQGSESSDDVLLFVPGFGANYQYQPDVTLGVAVSGYGAGIDYGKPIPAFGTSNVKSELVQMLIAPTATYQFQPGHYLGLSVKLGYESLMLHGLENFGATNDKDHALGAGLGIGYLGTLAPGLRLGVTYSTPVRFQKLDAHEDIIPKGRINMPQQAGLGLAYDTGPWTVAFDYLWIDWSREKALANSLTQGGAPGAGNGPGFGWRDQHVFRFGVNYQYSDKLQLRTGVSLANHQVPDREATLIAIAPCNQPKSAHLGFTYNVSEQMEVTGAYMYDLRHITKGKGASAGSEAGGELHMLTVGLGYKF